MEHYFSWRRQLDHGIKSSQSLEELIELSALFTRQINFDFFAYSICEPTPFTRPRTHIFGNYPALWLKRYKEKNYAMIDPTVHHCKCSIEPLRWSKELFEGCPQLWLEASGHHLNNGVVQPSFNTRGSVGLLSLSRENNPIDDDELEALKPLIKAFAETMGCRIFELDDTLLTAPDIEFREKEKEVLRWTADGKTSEEIGRILSVTADAVNFHLRNIQKKIGACNRVQAVTYAVAQGHI
ncbi:autoinducer binding domain-containing protein [Pseudomonas sp. O39]|uniref:autoinducer binding domain-containing protein n=1 Tax=unclassified Pseudomonas TaxID=196821 RepID=UPI00387AF81D